MRQFNCFRLARTALSSSAPPAAGRARAERSARRRRSLVCGERGVPRPLVAELHRRTHRRTRRPDMPASADKQALADELSHELRLARIVILDESRCQPTCPRTTICARRPASRLRSGPDVHRVRGGQVCGAGATLWRDRGGGSGWSQGMPDLPLVVSLEFYVCISTAFR